VLKVDCARRSRNSSSQHPAARHSYCRAFILLGSLIVRSLLLYSDRAMGDDSFHSSVNGGGANAGGATYLLSPVALQNVLTRACGKAYAAVNGESHSRQEDHAVRHAVLLTKEGILMCQSEGMEAERAAYVAGLAASVWQVEAAGSAAAAGDKGGDAAANGGASKGEKVATSSSSSLLGGLDSVLLV
jgi:hypothetical protein